MKDQKIDQINRIRKKLVWAAEADPGFAVFGSRYHQYRMNPPCTPEEIDLFEKQHDITLPEDFRLFLTEMGNGGAGPYYGIYPLNECYCNEGTLNIPNNVRPGMSRDEWSCITKADEDLSDEDYNTLMTSLFQGLLTIGTQGCSYESQLVVTGDYRGRIVYTDSELSGPFFYTYETTFLDWYERWLNEVIAGYDIKWFGMNMPGDEHQLKNAFLSNGDEKTRIDILTGMYKLPRLEATTLDFLEEQLTGSMPRVQDKALSLLCHFDFERARPHIRKRLMEQKEKQYSQAVLSLNTCSKDKDIAEFIPLVVKLIPLVTNPDNFDRIVWILNNTRDCRMEMFIPFFNHPEKEFRLTAIRGAGCSTDREQYLSVFRELLRDSDSSIVRAAIQALRGVNDERLIPYYKDIWYRFPDDNSHVRSNIRHWLNESGLPEKYFDESG